MLRRVVGPLLAAAALVTVTGCGAAGHVGEGDGNVTRGKQLFEENCAACHRLADSPRAVGDIGPDLDLSFGVVREQGFSESSIRNLVRAQIAYPVENPPTGEPGMPANLVRGDDAVDVAAYVASVAGRPVVAAPNGVEEILDGEQLFVMFCAGCHTLAAAGTTSDVAPSLDDIRPDASRVLAAMREGPGAMPTFDDRLSEEQLQNVAEYVAQNAGR
jgi:cytochrome c6